MERYYSTYYWQDKTTYPSQALNTLFAVRMRRFVRELRRLIPSSGTILDWGAGDGSLVGLLNRKGFHCYGIDNHSPACDEKRIFASTIDQAPFPCQHFDCITSFHVLEHLKDLKSSVRSAFNLLKSRGLFVAEVPNISSLQFRLFGNKWQPLEIPFHVNHFSPVTLSRLLTENVHGDVLKMSFFSHRVSPSALLLSVLPFLEPKSVRKKYGGRYPAFLKIVYLLSQLAVYPLALTEAYCGRGAIMRLWFRKRL